MYAVTGVGMFRLFMYHTVDSRAERDGRSRGRILSSSVTRRDKFVNLIFFFCRFSAVSAASCPQIYVPSSRNLGQALTKAHT